MGVGYKECREQTQIFNLVYGIEAERFFVRMK